MSTKLNAAGGTIRQVVSYLTLSNVSFDSSKNSVNIDDFQLYDSKGQVIKAATTTEAPVNETVGGLEYSHDKELMMKFTALWLLLLLLVPVLVLILCFCLSLSDKDESQLTSLMEKDWEAGGNRDVDEALAKSDAPD